MLYMKEMRPIVQAECTLKESAAINQILGRKVRKHKYYGRNVALVHINKKGFNVSLKGEKKEEEQAKQMHMFVWCA